MEEALREIAKIHARSTARAGEYQDGSCAYCQPGGVWAGASPLRRYRDFLNGSRSRVWMHEHPDVYPICEVCASGYDDRETWPCQTARLAIAGLDLA